MPFPYARLFPLYDAADATNLLAPNAIAFSADDPTVVVVHVIPSVEYPAVVDPDIAINVGEVPVVVIVGDERVLLVNVSVVARPTRVSVASGKVNVFAVVKDVATVPVMFVVLPDVVMLSFFVASVASTKFVVVVDKDLFVRVFADDMLGITTPSTASTPADDLLSVVSVA